MNKGQLVNAIARLQGKDANKRHLNGRTLAQLKETLARCNAIANTTQAEIDRHCNTGFI